MLNYRKHYLHKFSRKFMYVNKRIAVVFMTKEEWLLLKWKKKNLNSIRWKLRLTSELPIHLAMWTEPSQTHCARMGMAIEWEGPLLWHGDTRWWSYNVEDGLQSWGWRDEMLEDREYQLRTWGIKESLRKNANRTCEPNNARREYNKK